MADFPYDKTKVVWVAPYTNYSTREPEHCGWACDRERLRRGDHVQLTTAWGDLSAGAGGVVVDHDGDRDPNLRWPIVNVDGVWRQLRASSLRKVAGPTSFLDELLRVLT